MGFTAEQARDALDGCSGNVERAEPWQQEADHDIVIRLQEQAAKEDERSQSWPLNAFIALVSPSQAQDF